MPTSTASDDELLLDAVERQVMQHDMSVTLKRCWTNAGKLNKWQVEYKINASKSNGTGEITWASGGGVTLRDALQAAFANVAAWELSR